MQGTSASFSHPRDVAIAVIHRDGTRWRYDHATVARLDPRVVAWRSATTGRVAIGPAGDDPNRRVEALYAIASIDAKAAAVLPRATRFNRDLLIPTRRAHNQR